MPPHRDDVFIIIPAFHEQEMIGRVVRELIVLGWCVVVVDDGSTDQTGLEARAAGATVLRHAINRGQGAALHTGIDYALAHGARVLVTFDGDGQHDPHDILALLAALEEGADVALGSRFLGATEGASAIRVLFLRAAVGVSNLVSGVHLSDAHCGIRAFRREVAGLLSIHQDGMAHASEILRSIVRHRLKCKEIPVTVRYTDYSRGKGQSPIDAIRILFDYISKG